jgi:asparaginyl-tRNA synthetase
MHDTQLRSLLAVREAATDGARSYYKSSGLVEVAVPVIVGITGACENVSTLFRLDGSALMHLTQTGQLALEHALCQAAGVYCFTRSFRTDRIDERHLHEFTLVEEEICCDHPAIGMPAPQYDSVQMFEALLVRITGAVRAMVRSCVMEVPDEIAELGGNVDDLTEMLSEDFYRVTYGEAVNLLNKRGDALLEWGTDLGAAQEQQLVAFVAEEAGGRPRPTFVTHYPKAIKFFNMRVDDADPRVVQSADLLLPYSGEAVGSAVREHRYPLLVDRLTSSTMFSHIVARNLATLNDFRPYLEVIENCRTAPHAGYGIGLERVLQFILGQTDIREASVPYALSALMGFADVLAQSQSGSRSPGF